MKEQFVNAVKEAAKNKYARMFVLGGIVLGAAVGVALGLKEKNTANEEIAASAEEQMPLADQITEE